MSLMSFLDETINQAETARRQKEETRARAEKEEKDLRMWAAVTAYLTQLVLGNVGELVLSVKDFTGAILTLMGLGQLCGPKELELIQLAIMERPDLFHFAGVRQYFRQTQDGTVGKLYLDRFLYPSDGMGQPELVVAAKQALSIAAEAYAGNPEKLKKFALMVMDRGVPTEGAFYALLLSVSRSGILKEEPFEMRTDVNSIVRKEKEVKTSDVPDVAASVQRVQEMVLPGVTASLKDLVSHNATARAKANKKKKVA